MLQDALNRRANRRGHWQSENALGNGIHQHQPQIRIDHQHAIANPGQDGLEFAALVRHCLIELRILD